MAALLSDQIDRLNQRTRAIKSVAAQTAHTDLPTRISRPFTHAVLYAEIGQLIRDVDSTEFGLFTLSKRAPTDPTTHEGHLKRVEFVGATPLKKHPARRDEKAQELAPEIHAQSALKLLHRYHTIRPMPRASKQLSDIMDRLQGARERIAKLEKAIKEQEKDQQQAEPPVVGKSSLKAEEEAVRQLHARLEELNERKKQLQARKEPKAKGPIAKVTRPARLSSPLNERKFFGTPGEASRTLKFSTNLLDEEVDFNGLNDASFSMPTPQKDTDPGVATSSLNFTTSNPSPEHGSAAPGSPVEEREEIPPFDPAPKIKAPSPVPATPPRATPVVDQEPARPTPRTDSVRVNAQVDKITTKIAAVYGDLLSLAQEGKKPSSAKQIIACLRDVSAQNPALDSPSHSSVTTASDRGPTAQEVLTAYLLLQVLSAPGHSIPLNKLKDMISERTKAGNLTVGALGSNPTRILYGCVGKRVIAIDRSGGEQVVKFDC